MMSKEVMSFRWILSLDTIYIWIQTHCLMNNGRGQ